MVREQDHIAKVYQCLHEALLVSCRREEQGGWLRIQDHADAPRSPQGVGVNSNMRCGVNFLRRKHETVDTIVRVEHTHAEQNRCIVPGTRAN